MIRFLSVLALTAALAAPAFAQDATTTPVEPNGQVTDTKAGEPAHKETKHGAAKHHVKKHHVKQHHGKKAETTTSEPATSEAAPQ